jgi:subtilisin family serine protease
MRFVRSLAAALAAVGVAGAAQAQSAQDYVIVARGQGANSTAFKAQLGAELVASLDEIGVVLARSSDPGFAARAAALPGVQGVAADPAIRWLPVNEPAVQVTEDAGPAANAEPRTPLQWSMRVIHADQTAAAGVRGAGARVAVLDSGIATQHEDLKPNLNLALSKSFVPGEALDPPPNVFNHGSHVAGIIAAAINGVGTQGVAPEAELVAVKVLSAAGSGSFSWLIQGLDYASGPAVHADVINMSLGATFPRNPNAICDPTTGEKCGNAGPLMAALNRAMNLAHRRGTLLVSAAGNEGVDLNSQIVSIPAQSGVGMAVAATAPVGWALKGFANTDFDLPASYTNSGQSVVTLAAPGGDIVDFVSPMPNCTVGTVTRPCNVFDLVIAPGGRTAANGSIYFFAAGTSMAAPHVTGVAALLVGKYGHIGPTRLQSILTQSSVDILKPGADPLGKGRLDAAAAVGQ